MKLKYFIARHSYFRNDVVNEITSKTALELYKQNAGPGFLNLKAVPNFHKGVRIVGAFSDVWGEDITDAECFRRKLAGILLDGIWREGND